MNTDTLGRDRINDKMIRALMRHTELIEFRFIERPLTHEMQMFVTRIYVRFDTSPNKLQ